MFSSNCSRATRSNFCAGRATRSDGPFLRSLVGRPTGGATKPGDARVQLCMCSFLIPPSSPGVSLDLSGTGAYRRGTLWPKITLLPPIASAALVSNCGLEGLLFRTSFPFVNNEPKHEISWTIVQRGVKPHSFPACRKLFSQRRCLFHAHLFAAKLFGGSGSQQTHWSFRVATRQGRISSTVATIAVTAFSPPTRRVPIVP